MQAHAPVPPHLAHLRAGIQARNTHARAHAFSHRLDDLEILRPGDRVEIFDDDDDDSSSDEGGKHVDLARGKKAARAAANPIITTTTNPTAKAKSKPAPAAETDPAVEAAAAAKAALKEAKKNARKERKKQAKSDNGSTISTRAATPGLPSPGPTPALESAGAEMDLSRLAAMNLSADTVASSTLLTPSLRPTASIPSIPSYRSDSPAASFAYPSPFLDDPVAKARAAVKSAKKAAVGKQPATEQHNEHRPQVQPWETALNELPHVPSDRGAARASRTAIKAFEIPIDRQLLVDFDARVPTMDYDLSHNVASAIVEELVPRWGRWSITFSDPSYRIFITTDKNAAISFKVCKGLTSRVAVVFGDPICDPIILQDVILQFRAYCRARMWRTAFVGVTAAVAMVADVKRWMSVQFAVEQVADPMNNDLLDGTRGKRMRVAVKKLVKDRVLRMYNPADGVDYALEDALQSVYDDSYAAKEAERGDTTAYSTKLALFDLARVMTYFYTVDAHGQPNGFAGLMNVGEGRYLLDPVVSLPGAPRDTSDFLTYSAMGWLRRRGVRHMSFGLEPLREIADVRGLNHRFHETTALINAASYDAFGFPGKKTLHDKFYPDSTREQKLFLILGSRNCLTQLDTAMAITSATHLSATPVLRRLKQMMSARQAGTAIEGMLGKLVGKGRLPRGHQPAPAASAATPPAHSSAPASVRYHADSDTAGLLRNGYSSE